MRLDPTSFDRSRCAVTELAYPATGGKVSKPTIRATLEKFQEPDRWFKMLLAIMNAVEAK